MRQLLMVLSIIMTFNTASAIQDAATQRVTDQLITQLSRTQDKNQRLRDIIKYRDWLYQRLNTIDLPENFISLPDNSPVLESYRSLTEYDNYINLINMQVVNDVECKKVATRIERSTSNDGGLVQEASEALRILTALCR